MSTPFSIAVENTSGMSGFFFGAIASTASPSWTTLPIGPGGNILGVSFATDGTSVCRTDTGGAYVNTPVSRVWKQLITTASFPSVDATLLGSYDASTGKAFGGVYAVELAPSNSSRIYLYNCNGDVFRSDDKGNSFIKTAFSNTSVAVNGQTDSGWDSRIAVDPQNPNIVLVGTPTSGLFHSINSGGLFTKRTDVANATSNGSHMIAFDKSSTVSGGSMQGIYVSSYGTGVYHSTNGGVNWTLLNSTGMPTLVKKLVCHLDGTVYVIANDSTNNVYKYASGTWSTLTPVSIWGGNSIQAIACDPNNSSRVLVLCGGGNISESSDKGVTWSNTNAGQTRTAIDVPWLATTGHPGFADSHCDFDPSTNPAVLSVADGITVWTTTPIVYTSSTSYTLGPSNPTFTLSVIAPASAFPVGSGVQYFSRANNANNGAGSVTSYNSSTGVLVIAGTGDSGSTAHSDWTVRGIASYTSQGAGIEQLINNRVLVPPSGRPNVFVWDRCQFRSPSNSTYPTNQAYIATLSNEICSGWDGDYAYGTPTFFAGIFNERTGEDHSGYSTDGGQTFTEFASKTPYSTYSGNAFSGCMAVASATNIVWFPSEGFTGGGNRPWFTSNGGTSWSLCSFPVAVPTTGTTGWGTFSGTNYKIVCADRVAANTFYAWNSVTAAIYRSTDGGANWLKRNTGAINSIGGLTYLEAVPKTGSTDTTGWLFGTVLAAGLADCLVRSKDGGITWAAVSSTFTTVAAIGFGKSINGVVPAVLVAAIKSGVRGIYLSTDDCATWTNVTDSFDSADQIFDLDGDKDTAGIWYVATNSTGIRMGNF